MEHRYLDGKALEEELYHDARSLASVMISEENGLVVEGIISPTLRIKPLREQERTPEGKVPHLVYEYHDDSAQSGGRGIAVNNTAHEVSERQYNFEHRYDIPPIIYPEFLVMADGKFQKQFCSETELLRYIIITFNAANLRYLTVSKPAVKLRICALELLSADQEAFMERTEEGYVEGYTTLMGLQNYVFRYNYKKYKGYDAVFLFTGSDMVEYAGRNKWYHGLSGIAYIAGVCGSLKVALGEDAAGTYKGVRVFAHEAGHL
ncbi:venom metalloproteinase antarease-like TtrivMP_A [Haemaphysalis longicornis]